jgi:CheY-like chemotaxis protein
VVLTLAKSVLIMDDNAFVRRAVRTLFALEADFLICGEAENGREAIEKAQQLHPDLIVMDLAMPAMNGLEAARALKRVVPTIPIIMFDKDRELRQWYRTLDPLLVYRSVEWFVQWGLAQRELHGVEAIGVDEIHWGRGLRADNFLTVIYQIDAHCRRLLWVGKRRSKATLRRGLKALGPRGGEGLSPEQGFISPEMGESFHSTSRPGRPAC